MKNKLLTLIKKDLFLKYGSIFNSFTDPYLSKKEKLKSTVAPLLILFYMFFININMIVPLVSKDINKGPSMLISLIVACTLLVLVLTLTSTLSTFFLNEDIKILSKLPIKLKDIILSKIVDISLTNIVFFAVLLLPVSIYYGVKSNQDIFYYVSLLLGAIAVSLIFVSLVSLIILLLMKYITKIPNLKNILQVFYFTLFLIIFVGMQIMSPSNGGNNGLDMLSKVGNYSFFISKLYSSSLGLESYLNRYVSLLILVVSATILPPLVSTLTKKHFCAGLQQNSVFSAKRKKIKAKNIKKTSKTLTLVKKELLEVLKTPVYFFNMCIGGIMISIIFPLGFIFGAKRDGNMGLLDVIRGVRMKFLDIIGENLLPAIFISLVVGFAFSLFSSLSGEPAATSISREGPRIRFLKSLPITAEEHVKSRIIASISLKLISYAIIFIIAFIITFPHIYIPLLAIVGFILSSFFTSNLGLLFDIKSPKLKWTNPQLAVKQNMNIVKVMVSMFVIGFLIYQLLNFIMPMLPNDVGTISLALLSIPILFIIIGYFLYIYNISIFEKNLIKYEN